MGGGNGGDDDYEEMEQRRQAAVQRGTDEVNKIFARFDDPYYQQRSSAYNAWAMPQVEDKYKKAQENLMYALARQYGTTQSSEASDRQAELAKMYGVETTNVTDRGLSLANEAKQAVEAKRNEIINQLNVTYDPDQAIQAAQESLPILSAIDPYEPIGDLFYNVTEGLAGATYPYGLAGDTAKPISSGGKGKSKAASYLVTE